MNQRSWAPGLWRNAVSYEPGGRPSSSLQARAGRPMRRGRTSIKEGLETWGTTGERLAGVHSGIGRCSLTGLGDVGQAGQWHRGQQIEGAVNDDKELTGAVEKRGKEKKKKKKQQKPGLRIGELSLERGGRSRSIGSNSRDHGYWRCGKVAFFFFFFFG